MRKSLYALLMMSVLLFAWEPLTSYAANAGTTGDITFVDGNESGEKKAEIQPTGEQPKKPKGRIKLPSTGETEKIIWFIAGILILLFSSYLLIIKRKSRRNY